MAGVMEDIRKDYAGMLSGYLIAADEEARLHACELGRKALTGGFGVLDIVTLHHEVLASLGQADKLPLEDMAALIEGLLSLSRVTRSELRRETVDLAELTRNIFAQLRRAAPGRNVETVVPDELAAEGDVRLLRGLLENLLSNAWKFTGQRAVARIEVGITKAAGERAYFVRDDGAGFDMAYAGKLFGAFQRLHSATEFQGTGIGLATVQRIVHRHGGRIWAESEVGRGATFFFTLWGAAHGA
jgi:light-regulated signal transduction histidine kinase (bacteriophytochrome)